MRALVLVLLTACGGANAAPAAVVKPVAMTTLDGGAADAGGDSFPTLADLAARAPEVAPGMRELARSEAPRGEIVRAAAADTCVRLEFVSSAPVTVRLETSSGTPLASIEHSVGGLLAPRGPVCVRRGDGVRVTFDAAASARVRWIAWGAP